VVKHAKQRFHLHQACGSFDANPKFTNRRSKPTKIFPEAASIRAVYSHFEDCCGAATISGCT